MIDKKLKNFAVNLLRRGTFKWKPRGDAKKRYKVKVGEFSTGRAKYGYECSKCKHVFKSGEIQMDHCRAVVCPIRGFTGFDEYIERMYCEEENYISLCSCCHDIKTSQEKDFRVSARALAKEGKSLKQLEKEYEIFLKEYEE